MATQLKRMRLAPTWRAGLRRGRERNETMLLIQQSLAMQEKLRRIDAQLAAWGVEPSPMDRVKQPFNYARS